MWSLSWDGTAATLRPSIGNYHFPCQSHYYVTGNKVDWL
jgi:hypothetical protein